MPLPLLCRIVAAFAPRSVSVSKKMGPALLVGAWYRKDKFRRRLSKLLNIYNVISSLRFIGGDRQICQRQPAHVF